MNSPNLPTIQLGAPDALYDDIECELIALTAASLDDEDAVPATCVDEFATEFLVELSRPPCLQGRSHQRGR
jgi:hypothetical protein